MESWLYPYASEEVPRRGRQVMRPVVPVELLGKAGRSELQVGLIDTGSENVLAAEWLADLIGVDTVANDDRALIGIGGNVAEVVFSEVELQLLSPDGERIVDLWRADVGFVPGWQAPFDVVLGQMGFLDRYTVTFHRGAATIAIEDWSAFDERFGAGQVQ